MSFWYMDKWPCSFDRMHLLDILTNFCGLEYIRYMFAATIYPLHIFWGTFGARSRPIFGQFGQFLDQKSCLSPFDRSRGVFLPPLMGGVNSHVNLHMNSPSGRHMFWPPSRVLDRSNGLKHEFWFKNRIKTTKIDRERALNVSRKICNGYIPGHETWSESTLASLSATKRAQTQRDLFGNPHYHWMWKIFHLGKFTCEFTFHGNDHPVGRNIPLGTKYTHRVHWGTVFHPWSPLDLRSHQGPQIDDWPPPGWTVMVNSPHGCPRPPWVR